MTTKTLLRGMGVGLLAAAFCATLRAETYEEIEKQINAVAAEQVELQGAARDRDQAITRAMQDPKYSTPEIVALRTRIEQLKQELAASQVALRQQVEQLPELKPEAEKLRAENARIAELARRRAELQEQRARFVQPAEKPQ